jgi:hypothetical protein
VLRSGAEVVVSPIRRATFIEPQTFASVWCSLLHRGVAASGRPVTLISKRGGILGSRVLPNSRGIASLFVYPDACLGPQARMAQTSRLGFLVPGLEAIQALPGL